MGEIVRQNFVMPNEQRSVSDDKDQKMVNCYIETLYGKKWLVKRPGFSYFFQPGGAGTPEVEGFATCINMGQAYLGLTTVPVTVTVVATGGPLNISSITASAGFTITNNTCAALATGGECTLNLTFTPTGVGGVLGTLTIVSDSPTSPAVFNICAEGICADFGTILVGLTSGELVVTLQNGRAVPWVISSITPSNPNVTVSSSCGTIAAGNNCDLGLTWTPTVDAESPGTVTIVTDDGTYALELCGAADQIEGPYLVFTGASFVEHPGAGPTISAVTDPNDPRYPLAETLYLVTNSLSVYTVIKNIGNATFVGATLNKTGDCDFGSANGGVGAQYGVACTLMAWPFGNIAPGAAVSIQTAFFSHVLGSVFEGHTVITGNQINNPFSIHLRCVTGAPQMVVTPTVWDAGDWPVGAPYGTGPTQDFLVSNPGTGDLYWHIFTTSNFPIVVGSEFPPVLHPGDNYTFTVQFDPLVFGNNNKTGDVSGNAGGVLLSFLGQGT